MPGSRKRARKGFPARKPLLVPAPGVKRQEKFDAMKRRMRQQLENKVGEEEE